jgi:hypothetical protein
MLSVRSYLSHTGICGVTPFPQSQASSLPIPYAVSPIQASGFIKKRQSNAFDPGRGVAEARAVFVKSRSKLSILRPAILVHQTAPILIPIPTFNLPGVANAH